MVAERYICHPFPKVSPLFNEDRDDYEVWKKDVALWTSFTDIPAAKHGIAVHLSLKGRARAASSEISVVDMKSDNDLELIFVKLVRVFIQALKMFQHLFGF